MEPSEPALTEADAVPAHPDNEYGWEKLYAERMAQAYSRHYPIQVRIARFENCYGPEGTWRGGRERCPEQGRREGAGRDLSQSCNGRKRWYNPHLGRWNGHPQLYLR